VLAYSNIWLWLGPYLLLAFFTLYAMMEFTVSLLAKRPSYKRAPLQADKLHNRLLEIEEVSPPNMVVVDARHEIEFRWQSSSEQNEPFTIAKRASTQRIHLALDEARREVRACESSSSSYLFYGFSRWLPQIIAYAGYSAGPPRLYGFTQKVVDVILAGGWTFRPVVLPFQASWRAIQLSRRLTPPFLRDVPLTLSWGIVYPVSYCLIFVWFFALGEEEMRTTRNYGIALLVSTVWWGVWALITWLLCGAPKFWRPVRRE
jgi:hypothetical protein